MAISHRATGSWAAAVSTTQTVTLPTHDTGDMLLVRVAFKHATMPTTVTCDTAGWAKVGQYNSGTNASSNGGGSVIVAVFWKEATSASETNPTITYHASTNATPAAAVAISYQKGATEGWLTPVGAGGAGGTGTSISGTVGSHISTTAGDMVDFFLSQCDNNTLTSPNVTQTGVTFGTVSEQPATAGTFTDSNDLDTDGGYRLASSGTSSAAAVVTGTSTAGDESAVWTTRLRVQSVTTYQGSVTADATILKVQQGSVTADAYVLKVGESSVTADAYINKMFQGSVTADAYISKAYEGSVTADAYILKITEGSVTADAYILKTTSGSVTADSYILVVQTGSVTADSYILKTFEGSVTADAYVNAIQTGSVTADAEIAEAPATGPTWVSPADGVTIGATPTFVFTPQTFTGNKHFHMELCQVNTFNDGTLRSMKTNIAQAGWEYWNGSQWTAFPSTGMPDTYSGNNVRHTVQTALATGVWYRRVRAGG